MENNYGCKELNKLTRKFFKADLFAGSDEKSSRKKPRSRHVAMETGNIDDLDEEYLFNPNYRSDAGQLFIDK